MRYDWPGLYRAKPEFAISLLECWRRQHEGNQPFSWVEARVLDSELAELAREGLLRRAPRGYLLRKQPVLVQSAVRLICRGISEGTLESRGDGVEIGVSEQGPDSKELSWFMESVVKLGYADRSSTRYYWFNADREPALGKQLNHFVGIELPKIEARARQQRAAARAARRRARQYAERRAQQELAEEESRQALALEYQRLWDHGTLQEISEHYPTTDHLLEHLLSRGFTHRQLTSELHVGGSRLTRIRRTSKS
jgi:hypothetical protein